MRQRGAGSVPHALLTGLYTELLPALAKSRTLALISCSQVKRTRHLSLSNLSNQAGLGRLHSQSYPHSDLQRGHRSWTKHSSSGRHERRQPLGLRKSAVGQQKRRSPMNSRIYLRLDLRKLMEKALLRRKGKVTRAQTTMGMLWLRRRQRYKAMDQRQ